MLPLSVVMTSRIQQPESTSEPTGDCRGVPLCSSSMEVWLGGVSSCHVMMSICKVSSPWITSLTLLDSKVWIWKDQIVHLITQNKCVRFFFSSTDHCEVYSLWKNPFQSMGGGEIILLCECLILIPCSWASYFGSEVRKFNRARRENRQIYLKK